MKNNPIEFNKNIFTVFVGLIASGYDLVDKNCNCEIIKHIDMIEFGEEINSYFRQAKTGSCEVNPYWPRAFLLSLAGLHISEQAPFKYKDFDRLKNYIYDLENINPNEIGEETFSWLEQLPAKLQLIQDKTEFQELWNNYLSVAKEGLESYNFIVSEAITGIIDTFNISPDELPQIVVIPNLLQAPQATDYVIYENIIYIIKAKPDKESVIHEFLHHILGTKLKEQRERINKYMFLLTPVLDEMIRYQYAWAYDEDSWNRVFEENFMRAASSWINYYNNFEQGMECANLHKKYGFTYTPIILSCFISKWEDISKFDEFIEACLIMCGHQQDYN